MSGLWRFGRCSRKVLPWLRAGCGGNQRRAGGARSRAVH